MGILRKALATVAKIVNAVASEYHEATLSTIAYVGKGFQTVEVLYLQNSVYYKCKP